MIFLLAASTVFACFAVAPAIAQNSAEPSPTVLPQGNNHVQPFESLRYLITEGEEFDPPAVLERRNEFAPIESAWIDFGDQDGSVWLLARISNPSDRAGRWLVDIQRPFADRLIVQKVTARGVTETLLSVDRGTSFGERPVVSQYLVAPLWMGASETAEILVGLQSATGSWMPLTFVTEERMRTAHMQEARFNWIINGAMLALVIIALAMGRLVGWPLVLSFAAYVGLSAMFVANNEGYLHRFLWPGSMGAYEPANLILLSGMMAAVLQFARLFAGLRANYPMVHQTIVALQLALLAVGGASLFLWHLDAMRWAVFLLVPFVALAYFATAILAWRKRVLGAIPFIAGSLAILLTVAIMVAMLLAPGRFPLTVALDYFHLAVLFESLAFLIAILVRMLAMQADLNRSLEAEVAAARDKLALSEALHDSNNRYNQAREQAETMRSRLASTSHDLQQPLLSLRQGLESVAQRDPKAASEIHSALDYLETVTESGLDASDPQTAERPDTGTESFPVSLILDNCAAMFRAEAEEQNVELRVKNSLLHVTTDPIDLMRSVCNLVSNALKHAQGSKILVAAQARGKSVILRVIDNGRGMEESTLAELMEPGAKSSDSEGHGLGLALVAHFARRPGHDLEVKSTAGKGTCISLSVPRSI
ncbi:MAG: sensor histidine kinase [Pseudomonadota bacterium]